MSAFSLTPHQIEHGLDRDALSVYANYPVALLDFDGLSHAKELARRGTLTEGHATERGQEIKKIALNGTTNFTADTDFLEIALSLTTAIHVQRFWRLPLAIEHSSLATAHRSYLATLRAHGVDDGIHATDFLYDYRPFLRQNPVTSWTFTDAEKVPVIFPGFPFTPEPASSSVVRLGYPSAAVLMLRRQPLPEVIATTTGIPLNAIGKLAAMDIPGHWHDRWLELHDMRHTRHLKLDMPMRQQRLADLYIELDADLFARSVLRRAKAPADFLKLLMHMRYASMFVTPPRYSFAPVMEAIEHGAAVPSGQSVFANG